MVRNQLRPQPRRDARWQARFVDPHTVRCERRAAGADRHGDQDRDRGRHPPGAARPCVDFDDRPVIDSDGTWIGRDPPHDDHRRCGRDRHRVRVDVRRDRHQGDGGRAARAALLPFVDRDSAQALQHLLRDLESPSASATRWRRRAAETAARSATWLAASGSQTTRRGIRPAARARPTALALAACGPRRRRSGRIAVDAELPHRAPATSSLWATWSASGASRRRAMEQGRLAGRRRFGIELAVISPRSRPASTRSPTRRRRAHRGAADRDQQVAYEVGISRYSRPATSPSTTARFWACGRSRSSKPRMAAINALGGDERMTAGLPATIVKGLGLELAAVGQQEPGPEGEVIIAGDPGAPSCRRLQFSPLIALWALPWSATTRWTSPPLRQRSSRVSSSAQRPAPRHRQATGRPWPASQQPADAIPVAAGPG